MWTKVLAVLVGLVAGLWWFQGFDEGVIRGQRVLVTGASTGIGEQLAYHYARMGASVMVTARRTKRLQEVVARCRELGSPNATFGYVVGDMSNLSFTKDLIRESTERMGGLDYLVLNHILTQDLHFWSGNDEDMAYLDKVFEVNFKAYVHLASHALPELEKSGGHVVVLSSFAGKSAPPFSVSYAATKYALGGFFSGLRQELRMKDSNVSITMCIVGFIATENALSSMAVVRDGVPLQRLIGSAASPSDTALDIIRGAANRQRELYTPFLKTYTTLFINSLFPSAIDYLIRAIYAQ
ncbi:hydroxysteroid 11-beta-dehydrogenase 1-like protein [Mizuhopecten yessoensis]|uniref:Hydroxysteroid 11-beta-dehydrogenase 1-like protein n=1 Tax=Mizuhopecten yessoensis TaxID=6573 RepID=A0A210Q8Z8_MIZYE|nr:hydroxysteroid 11-beta-dehydrogenase 1-like protein [Mizuhopecten yessoensis]XP_021364216.1 hydroxysteroid 11-beta-dehydrogenase 1-like protein [Mizuhopecten yessoensis]OWF45220.1 Hydroxysteroid 11-beta-dehydrogenase 1-like protein [Mizuhopecten yessoensis]